MSTKIVDHGWKKIKREMKVLKSSELVVGVLDAGIAEYAAYNEFGTSKMPSRSFIRSTLENDEASINKAIKSSFEQVLNGGSAYSLITKAGLHIQGLIQKTIRSGVGPVNSPATIKKKGHGKTLRDSGALMGAISFEVR